MGPQLHSSQFLREGARFCPLRPDLTSLHALSVSQHTLPLPLLVFFFFFFKLHHTAGGDLSSLTRD